MKESLTGDHQSNGEIEVAVRELKRQIRALKSLTETKLGIQLKDDDPMLMWLPRHAAFLISRLRLGKDGKSAYSRQCGKTWRWPTIMFGERIMFRNVKSCAQGPHWTLHWDASKKRRRARHDN